MGCCEGDCACEKLEPRAAILQEVKKERIRQIEAEFCTLEYDDKENACQELAQAAAAYIMPERAPMLSVYFPADWTREIMWPVNWKQSFKACERRRELIKGMALALAEIERLDRAAAKPGGAK